MKTTRGNKHELKMRCPFCGDSKRNPDKTHFSIQLPTGLYHCYRCGAGGRYSPRELWDIAGVKSLETIARPEVAEWDLVDLANNLVPGPGSPRTSLLRRLHIPLEKGLVDVFEMRTPYDVVTGYQLRLSWEKKMVTFGDRSFGYVQSGPLVVSDYIRLVEGPYDVVDEHDVCLWGLPSASQLKSLAGYPLVLCPDGDIFQDERKKQQYFGAIARSDSYVVGLEYLPDGLDPDEVPVSERTLITENVSRIVKQLGKGGTPDGRASLLSRGYHRGGRW